MQSRFATAVVSSLFASSAARVVHNPQFKNVCLVPFARPMAKLARIGGRPSKFKPYKPPTKTDKIWRSKLQTPKFSLPKNLSDIEAATLKGKRVLVRVDVDVPVKDGKLGNEFRLAAAIPTIEYLRANGARVVLCGHLGSPSGAAVETLRMAPVSAKLAKLLNCHVKQLSDCVGEDVKKAVGAMKDGDVIMLENVSFHAGEASNSKEFAQELAKATQADLFVNDCFSNAHRSFASTTGVAEFIPGDAVSGHQLKKELTFWSTCPARAPLAVIVGGAYLCEMKKEILEKLLYSPCKTLILGGVIANTFFKARGLNVGASKVQADCEAWCHDFQQKAFAKRIDLFLPVDVCIAENVTKADARHGIVAATSIPDNWHCVDMGPRSLELIDDILFQHRTIFWTGAVGMVEKEAFAAGTKGKLRPLHYFFDFFFVLSTFFPSFLLNIALLGTHFPGLSFNSVFFPQLLLTQTITGITELLTKYSYLITAAGGRDTLSHLSRFGCTVEYSSTGSSPALLALHGAQLPGTLSLDAGVWEEKEVAGAEAKE